MTKRIKRRTFLDVSLKSAAGMSLMLAGGLPRRARALADNNTPLYIFFDARGGWDTSSFLDPYGGEPYSSQYAEGDILTLGNHRYAPKTVDGGTPVPYLVGPQGNKADFFQTYGSDLLVLHGVDTQTNSHDVGPRHVFGGNLRQGTPALSALVAAIFEETNEVTLPMTLLSTGGYDNTAGLLPPARVGSASVLLDISAPYRIDADNPANVNRFLPQQVEDQVRLAQEARHARIAGEETLPFRQKMHDFIDRARSAEPSFEPLHAEFMAMPALSPEEAQNPLIPRAQVALAAMRAGVCVSTMLSHGGFDTHGTHDVDHPLRMQQLLDAIDYTMRTLASLDLLDRATVVVGSDFARTLYNDTPGNPTRGKDHWPITSMMLMGAGVSGGRVVGGTLRHDADGGAGVDLNRKGVIGLPVKEVAGELVTTSLDDPEGFMLRPAHVHDSLRELAGIRTHPLSVKYALDDVGATPLPLL